MVKRVNSGLRMESNELTLEVQSWGGNKPRQAPNSWSASTVGRQRLYYLSWRFRTGELRPPHRCRCAWEQSSRGWTWVPRHQQQPALCKTWTLEPYSWSVSHRRPFHTLPQLTVKAFQTLWQPRGPNFLLLLHQGWQNIESCSNDWLWNSSHADVHCWIAMEWNDLVWDRLNKAVTHCNWQFWSKSTKWYYSLATDQRWVKRIGRKQRIQLYL